MSGDGPLRDLARLADLHGVRTSYLDIAGRAVTPSPDAVLAVLRAMGIPAAALPDVPDALRESERALWRRLLPPVLVAWGGDAATLTVRLPQARAEGRLLLRLVPEEGEVREATVDLAGLPAAETAAAGGERFVAKRVAVFPGLPPGYHRLLAQIDGEEAEALLIGAPARAYREPDGGGRDKPWGLFLPLYALRTERSVAAGDLSDLGELLRWTGERGGRIVGTLPLLSAFLTEPFHPSPYSPASRLFWNEFYLDLSSLPGLSECPEAQELLASDGFRREAAELSAQPHVDYRRGMALKRRVLSAVARRFFQGPEDSRRRFQAFLDRTPDLPEYASFRAACERRRAPWPAWPSPMREGTLPEAEYDAQERRYHEYAQWAFEEQFSSLAREARERGQSLYLDLPLGVSYDSFDVWRHRDRFVLSVSAGAPPDDFFTKGQDWGFPPLHPETIREDGYRYYRECLRRQLSHAGVLRIDHVMGFHRFFWVPHGREAREGTYVRYEAEEFYAILALESHRHRSRIVGEDLGTVPDDVRPAMDRRGISRMFVVQFSLSPEPARALDPVPGEALASVNTHDMPPFAGFWNGADILDRVALGLLEGEELRVERRRREDLKSALARFLRERGLLSPDAAGERDVLLACLAWLGGGNACAVVANLEDLWGEREPQNVPGTWKERPNWTRRARFPLEAIRTMPEVAEALARIGAACRGARDTG